MIFKRTLQRDLIFYTTAVYAALILVTLTFTLIRLLTQAVDGKIDPQSVFVLLGFALVNFQALIMSLSVFIGTLLVYGRMWRDSEMIVWQSSGLSLRRFVSPTMRFALPIAVLAAVFSGLIAPWANEQASQYRDVFTRRNDISRIAAEQFKENGDGSRVFYVGQSDEATHSVSNVFILEKPVATASVLIEPTEPIKPTDPTQPTPRDSAASVAFNAENIVAAAKGTVYTAPTGEQYLQLNQGRRYQLPSSNPAEQNKAVMGLMQFDQYRTLLSEKPNASNTDDVPVKQRTSLSLLEASTSPALADKPSAATLDAQGEIIWRLSGPLICLMVALLAIPLSYFNPRSGKSAPLVLAVLIFTVYVNTISLSQNYLQASKIKLLPAIIAPHGAVLLLSVLLLLWRSQWFMQVFGGLWRTLRHTAHFKQAFDSAK
jgi:lipopolysaccharide export system permease protein